MSIQFGKVCSLILADYFGPIIEKVGRDLFSSGQKPLKLICASSKLSLEQVRQSLCILIQYGLVSYFPGKQPHAAEYKLNAERVILLLRYPKYLMLMKTLYGNESEIVIEEILRVGSDTASSILVRAHKRVLAANSEVDDKKGTFLLLLKNTFDSLVTKEYIMRCPVPVGNSSIPSMVIETEQEFKPVHLDMGQLMKAVQGADVKEVQDRVLWRVNFDRFHQDMRDDLLILSMSRRVAPPAGDVLRLLLQQVNTHVDAWAPVSNPVLVSDLKTIISKSKTDPMVTIYLEDYLAVMAEDPSQFLFRSDSIQLAYQVNLKQAVHELAWCVICTAVEVKFGTNAGRIFRLIRQQEFIEQEEIQKRAMLPDKEAKLLTYSLLHGGWIQQHELKKGLQKAGPTKTFYLFCIDMGQIVRMFVEVCYKSLYNAIARREYEKGENKALLEKKQRVDTIALHMKKEGASDEQVAEIEEMVSPPERQILEKIQMTVGKLTQAELQVDETLFILQLYLASL